MLCLYADRTRISLILVQFSKAVKARYWDVVVVLIIAVIFGPLLVSYWIYVIFKLFAMLYIKRFGNNTFCISDYVEAHLRRWMKHD